MQRIDWISKWKPDKLEKRVDFYLTKNEEMAVVKKIARICPELLKILIENPKWRCPFPFECNEFPCGDNGCHADVCENGYARRLS